MEKINRLKSVLDSQGRSQSWLANKLGISSNAINAICSNRSQPSLKRLRDIASILGVNVCNLIEPVEVPTESEKEQ